MNKQTKQTEKKAAVLQQITLADLGLSPCKPIAQVAFSQWVRALLQNWRQGTVKTKGRAEVARTNKKPWKQKGTGRARAGTARSPLWRGGGVTFGPNDRSRTLSVPQKVKQRVMQTMLQELVQGGKVAVLDWDFSGNQPKTSLAFAMLKKAGLAGKKLSLFLARGDMLTYASFVNMKSVKVFYFDQANVYDAAHGNQWVFLKKDLDHFKEMVSRWT